MSKESKDGLPTGVQPGVAHDVADPHPERDTDHDAPRHPGGATPPQKSDVGSNSYAHDGTAPPRPKSKTGRDE